MKRKTLLSIFFFCAALILAQTTYPDRIYNAQADTITLNDFSCSYRDEVHGKFIIRDYYEFTNPSRAGTFKLPYKEIILALPVDVIPEIKILDKQETIQQNVIPISNPSVEFSTDSSLVYKKLEPVEYSNQVQQQAIVEAVNKFWFRGIYCVTIRINSHRFDVATNTLQILDKISFIVEYPVNNIVYKTSSIADDPMISNLVYNWSTVKNLTNINYPSVSDSLKPWIQYTLPYIKIAVGQNSIFKITKQDLISKGFYDAGMVPRTFKIYNKGGEIPIKVVGEDDGTFDENDYIEFWGTKNYPVVSPRIINSDSEEYNEYINRYTDSSYYFLTWGNENGIRIPVYQMTETSVDTIDYYYDLLHTETNLMLQNVNTDEVANQTPDWNKNKTWYWAWLFVQNRDYSFVLNNVYKDKTLQVFMKLVSAGSNIVKGSHTVTLKLNGLALDSQIVDRNKQVLLNGIINSNNLIDGSNKITVGNLDNGTSPNYLAVDWYEVEYPRKLVAVNDSLSFKLDPVLNEKIRVVKITGISTNDVILWKIKPLLKEISNYEITGTTLVFTDTTKGNDEYLLIKKSAVESPAFIYKKVYNDLLNPDLQADYIAITHPEFMIAAQQYVDNISKLYNVTSRLADVNDIYDEFAFGYPYPEAIKTFLQYAFINWKDPKPKYLTLIGDADYDYKRYRYKNEGVKGGGNYVSSYGYPVSDNWYTTWSQNNLIPQMVVGRLPINSAGELNDYYNKVINNAESEFSSWNKRYIFFSGGIGSEQELNQFKSANDSVINRYVVKKPLGGRAVHFYKTADPQSDFGPVTPQFLNSVIDDGALIISYLGHSGTATWDNSINEVTQLSNKINRNPLIIDFGCSTNKFAEPDIVSFGERFTLNPDGQALGYIGNSSLGFTSTAFASPSIFFDILSKESNLSIGEMLFKTKLELFNKLGSSQVNNIFALTSTLLGDPAVKIKLPIKPNLFIDVNGIAEKDQQYSSETDSSRIDFVLYNYGKADDQHYSINFIHRLNDAVIDQKNINRALPLYSDTLSLWIRTKNLPGKHTIEIVLDNLNQIDEINEDDNTLNINVNVYASTLRDFTVYNYENTLSGNLKILGPSVYSQKAINCRIDFAHNPSFNGQISYNFQIDSLYADIPLNSLVQGQRYWYRLKIDDDVSEYSKPKSFLFAKDKPKFYLNDSVSFSGQKFQNIYYQNGKIIFSIDTVNISVTSAGWAAGSTCVIAKNGINLLSNSFFAGMGIVVFEPSTLTVEESRWFSLFNQPGNMTQLVQFIDSIPNGKIVAMGVADDAANNINSALTNAIKTLGSTKIDSLVFRGSWALIGRKGGGPEDVIERVKKPYDGLIRIEQDIAIANESGTMETNLIGPASKWKDLIIDISESNNAGNIYPIGITHTGQADMLKGTEIKNGITDLSWISAEKYNYLKLIYRFTDPGTNAISINNAGVDYTGIPELAINYQIVPVSIDSVKQGENINLIFNAYNIGESTAANFKVSVDLMKSKNESENIFETTVDSLMAGSNKLFKIVYSTIRANGAFEFRINIDSENSVKEFYKDNNIYSVPFYVIESIQPQSLAVTFDGNDIIDGDYISPQPKIKVELSDLSLVPVTDTNAVSIFLNNNPVYYSVNADYLSYSYSANNPKMLVNYSPKLEDGEYTLKVVAAKSNNVGEKPGITKKFAVNNKSQLLYVYNYPNPFTNDTYFTFKLTQIPDEFKIKIFTIAGRLIKEILVSPSDLNYDFNRIYWDGRDEDGSLLANGVYLYKVIMKKGIETVDTVQKLAIVR